MKRKMTRERFTEWAKSRGWLPDRFGHLRREENGRAYRFKLSRIAVRHEVKSRAGWVRLRSGCFSKLTITPDGDIAGLTR